MTTNIDNRGPISNQAANQYIKNAYLLVHMNDESVEFKLTWSYGITAVSNL
jgi:hypothetical protein